MNDLANPRPRRFGAQFFVTLVLILIAAGAGATTMYFMEIRKPLEENVNQNRKMQLGLTGSDGESAKLADKYVDEDNDMVADPPKDASQLIDPPTLVFCYVAQEEEDKYQQEWKPFCDYLSKATGKPVEYLVVHNSEEQLKALADGKLHVTGLNTGAVPEAVNNCGFVPVCRVPTDDPGGTHVEIIVPTSSPINSLADLKGHELTLTEPNSNSGYKAPMVLLKSDFSLEPERDYFVRMSNGHEVSIAGIAKGEYQAAAVASDMLARAQASGAIAKNQYRSVYKSENFPSAALGYAYNLKPELAAKIKEAMLSFDMKGTSLEADFGSDGATKFVPVNYKNDWALIRRIDEESIRLRAAK
jgi:phosphonate transport system substrate-binding protein